ISLPGEFLPLLWRWLDGPDLADADPTGWHFEWDPLSNGDAAANGRIDLARADFSGGRLPLCILVEKILEADEPLPNWPVAGTTGYEFLDSCSRLFVDPRGFRDLERKYRT